MEYAKYRARPAKPSAIEALQFVVGDRDLASDVHKTIISKTNGRARVEELEDGTQVLTILHSGAWWIDVDPGDYIIRQGGRYFPVRKAVFEKAYEPLDAPAEKPKRVRRTKAQIAADAAAKEAGL